MLGTTTATASGGIATFSSLSYTNMEIIDLSFSSGALPVIISSSINVGPGPVRKLIIITQPSSSATAGQTFAQQPQVRLQDQYGNLCANDTTTVVTAKRSTGKGTLQGATNVTASAGVATFTDLNYLVAETMNIVFTGGAATNATSSNVVVSAGAFTKLRMLAPGETAAPGTVNGKSGNPTNQAPDTAFNVTVQAVDDNWNLVNTATDLIGISSSDIFATLPTNGLLVAGTKQFSVKLSESGTTNSVTVSDLTDGTKAAALNAIPVSARFTSATGGNPIGSSTAGASYTTLTGPTYIETAAGAAGRGTIILSTPAGFVFDTGGTAPTVRIDRVTTLGGKTVANINNATNGTSAAMTSVSSTQLVFTVNTASAGATCKLTWQNVRVSPIASSPLAVGKLTKSGTSVMVGVTNGVSNLGTLREILDAPLATASIEAQTSSDGSNVAASSASESEDKGKDKDKDKDKTHKPHKDGNSNGTTSVSVPVTITGLTPVDQGIQITLTGPAGSTYQVQRTLILSVPSWETIGTTTTDSLGNAVFTDVNPPASQAFYRTSR